MRKVVLLVSKKSIFYVFLVTWMKTFRTFLRYFACYYLERIKILRILINMCKRKIDSPKLHAFSFLSIFFNYFYHENNLRLACCLLFRTFTSRLHGLFCHHLHMEHCDDEDKEHCFFKSHLDSNELKKNPSD